MDRAMKHFMIAAKIGCDASLEEVSERYKAGHVTKDEYASTLRAYKATQELLLKQPMIKMFNLCMQLDER